MRRQRDQAMTDDCSVPRCRAAAVLRYYDVDLCGFHWDHLASLDLADAMRWLDPVRSARRVATAPPLRRPRGGRAEFCLTPPGGLVR